MLRTIYAVNCHSRWYRLVCEDTGGVICHRPLCSSWNHSTTAASERLPRGQKAVLDVKLLGRRSKVCMSSGDR